MGEQAVHAVHAGISPSPSAGELAGRIARREISAARAVGDAFARISALDDRLAAFCVLDEQRAMDDAAAVDDRLRRGETVGPLAGGASRDQGLDLHP